MSDLAATQCCNNDCGCSSNCNNGFSWIWILILLEFCGGCGFGFSGRSGCGNSCGSDDCCWIIILLLLFGCGGFGCGNNSCC